MQRAAVALAERGQVREGFFPARVQFVGVTEQQFGGRGEPHAAAFVAQQLGRRPAAPRDIALLSLPSLLRHCAFSTVETSATFLVVQVDPRGCDEAFSQRAHRLLLP
ncbi:hypothetical protein M8542_20300 [Amycolatopsis sp. OK19-0408]|uniref:Uncharacterized protein n=2 Tax=Amycolatopsis iheyensis TaxID=2945988 RepID=A0A9X2NAQ0_9PSEU|nr:hypothetical protein [Amycolatopsis iheyensis]